MSTKSTILVIEDEPAYRLILQDTFEREQFDVILAPSGKQDILEVAKTRPDVILLDIMLPGGFNGFDLLEQLKGNDRTKSIPVIILTNLASEEKVAKKIGAECYFIKADTTVDQIISKVKELIT